MPEFYFPEGFLWGSATSAHQVEGNNTNNDWWAWEQAGRVKETSGLACDQFNRFREDFDLAKQLGHNAHRISVEWSRIEPNEGQFDESALDHYREVVCALRERNIEPIVTLHHFASPQWLAAKGGWLQGSVVDLFGRYSAKIYEALGKYVRLWITINEPMVFVWMHYLQGLGPPGEKNMDLGFKVLEHVMRSHGAASYMIHKISKENKQDAQVSVAHHTQPFDPCRRWWPGDRLVAYLTEHFYNQNLLDALTEGRLRIPGRKTIRIEENKNSLDFLGMNFYGRVFMRQGPLGKDAWVGIRCSTRHHREVVERNCMDWDVHPPTLNRALRWSLPYRLPVLISENGICTSDDLQRQRFIANHIKQAAIAIRQGIPVMGYLYWSLIDNFEWADGYGPRFGLVEVDYKTQKRTARDSAFKYAQICKSNRINIE
jgi:beta-glucosidase